MGCFDICPKQSLVSPLTFAGVGKTVIAAFDYKRFKQQHPTARLLFVAHRKEILEQTMRTFQEILNDFNFGEAAISNWRNMPRNIFLRI